MISACTTTTSNKNNSPSEADQAEQQVIHDIEKLMADFPEPSLVPFTLKSIGAPFKDQLIHTLEKIDSYKDNTDKMALNMGVYASDISYLAAFGIEDKCIEYLRAAHSMAKFLGDSAIYNESDINEFRGHIASGNQKQISNILSKLFLETSVKMEEDHHLTMAGLALTGSFIEGLYHAVITLEQYPNTAENKKMLAPLVKIVLGEEQALLDLIQVLDDLPFDDTIADMMTELSILDRLYKGDLQQVEENIAKDPDYLPSKDVMRDITLEVKRIRGRITE